MKQKGQNMKKISILSLIMAFIAPVFAEESVVAIQDDNVIAEQPLTESETEKSEIATESNPKIRFPHGLQVGVGVSVSSGLNGFIGYNNKNFDSFWAKRFGVRFDFASISPIKTKLNSKINDALGDEGIEIDDDLNINNISLSAKHFGALIDFYPFGDTWFLGGLRLSGGYMSGKMDINADIDGTLKEGKIEFELGDRKYCYEGNVMHGKADLNWKYSGPYLGAGFDLGLFLGFKIYMDAGVVFAGNGATIDLDVPLNGLKDITDGTPKDVQNTALTEKFEQAKRDALREAQEELDKVDFYPLVKIGFMYRF